MHEAVLRLSSSDLAALGLREVVEHPTSPGIEKLTELVTHGPRGILHIVMDEPLPPSVLDTSQAAVWWERMMTAGDGATYLLNVQPHDQGDSYSILDSTADLGNHEEPHAEIEASVIGPITYLQQSVTLRSGTERPASGTHVEHVKSLPRDKNPLARLTDRQEQILRLAHESGYYEVPRTASSADIATELALDPSTVAEHLQRAERNLMDGLLE